MYVLMQSLMYVHKYSLFQAVIISALVPVAILIYPPGVWPQQVRDRDSFSLENIIISLTKLEKS